MSFTASRIVLPIDFSDASLRAASAALQLAGGAANVHCIHVLQPLETISPGAVWGGVTDTQREKSVREHATQFLTDNGLSEATFATRLGQPAHEVCEYARDVNADMIVISTHGYHGMKRVLLGSTAETIIRHAACDVLVLRRPDAE